MWMSRAALEILGTGGLGTSIDPLVPDPGAITEYGKSIKNLMYVDFTLLMRECADKIDLVELNAG